MTTASKSYLIPIKELLPAEISRIRNEAIDKVVAMVSAELKKPAEELVVRDIRPYSDLAWCTVSTPTIFAAALSTDTWCPTLDASDIYQAYTSVIISTSQLMADSRWVVITGVKDFRLAEAAAVKQSINFLKINTGGNDRVIWDLSGMQCYPDAMAAISPSPVVIPQNTSYNIYIYDAQSDDGSAVSEDVVMYLVLDGFVVEPKGKVLSP